MKHYLILLTAMSSLSGAAGWLPLWPGKIAGATTPPVAEVTTPEGFLTDTAVPAYEIYLPPAENRSGAAVVIFPGGGYTILAIGHEGRDYAAWLNERGIAAIVVKYRVSGNDGAGMQFPAPLLDARRAIRTTRANAAAWAIDPQKIGVMGSSAGGHLASMAATLSEEIFNEEGGDEIDKLACRPDFQILVYPVIALDQPWGHGGSKRRLLGETPAPELVTRLATHLRVDGKTPPAFLVHSADDLGVPMRNSAAYAAACAEHRVPVVCHIYGEGGHGYGLKGGGDSSHWPQLLDQWLSEKKFSRGGVKADQPDSFLGLTEEAAMAAATRLGVPKRIVEKDGEKFKVTKDYRAERLNFKIEKGLVTRVTLG